MHCLLPCTSSLAHVVADVQQHRHLHQLLSCFFVQTCSGSSNVVAHLSDDAQLMMQASAAAMYQTHMLLACMVPAAVCKQDHKMKLAISYALAQSTKLSVVSEAPMQTSLSSSSSSSSQAASLAAWWYNVTSIDVNQLLLHVVPLGLLYLRVKLPLTV
jgi:hypothetical protein